MGWTHTLSETSFTASSLGHRLCYTGLPLLPEWTEFFPVLGFGACDPFHVDSSSLRCWPGGAFLLLGSELLPDLLV